MMDARPSRNRIWSSTIRSLIFAFSHHLFFTASQGGGLYCMPISCDITKRFSTIIRTCHRFTSNYIALYNYLLFMYIIIAIRTYIIYPSYALKSSSTAGFQYGHFQPSMHLLCKWFLYPPECLSTRVITSRRPQHCSFSQVLDRFYSFQKAVFKFFRVQRRKYAPKCVMAALPLCDHYLARFGAIAQ